MAELILRVLSALGLVVTSRLLGKPDFDLAWRLAAIFSAYSVVVWLVERRSLRTPGIAATIAILDSLAISAVLGATSNLSHFAFLVLLPIAYSVSKYGAVSASMTPVIAATIVAASIFFGSNNPDAVLLAQTAGILMVGLCMTPNQVVMTVTREVPSSTPPVRIRSEFPADYLDLRESFRKLRDHCRELERVSRRDRCISQLVDVKRASGLPLPERLAKKLKEMTGALGVTIHLRAELAEVLVVHAAVGDLPEIMRTAALNLSRGVSDLQQRHQLDVALRAFRSEDDKQQAATVLLKDRGRLLGVMSIVCRSQDSLNQALPKAEEAAPVVAAILSEDAELDLVRRRLKEVEILYEVSAVTTGADSATNLASRLVRDLWGTVSLDHLGVTFLDGKESLQVASQGIPARLIEVLKFGSLVGLEGWISAGSEEITIFDTADDARCPKNEALRRRIGSFCLIPIQFDDQAYGYLTAATHAVGGIDVSQLETLRVVVAELSQAIARLEQGSNEPQGLATPREFQQIVSQATSGFMVYLEPIRLDELHESFGKPAVDHALRTFARRMRTKLPKGGLLCLRPEGDFVAYLGQANDAFSRSWANEATAMASMIGLKTPNGKQRIPLALRARVASVAPQKSWISEEIAV